MRQVRIRGNDELLEQYWNYTYDILERYASLALGTYVTLTRHE